MRMTWEAPGSIHSAGRKNVSMVIARGSSVFVDEQNLLASIYTTSPFTLNGHLGFLNVLAVAIETVIDTHLHDFNEHTHYGLTLLENT